MRALLCAMATTMALIPIQTSAAADDRGEQSLARILEGRSAGAPVRCIDTRRAFTAEIVDKTAIVYEMPDGVLYVNRPQAGVGSLDRQSIIEPTSMIGRTCRGDRVNLVESGGKAAIARGAVLLGDFTPYAKIKRQTD